MTDKIPVTVLTGFLGAGKTTLLNRILSEQHGARIAVIENEFGEIGIDQALVINADEEIFEMNNGCICCTVRGDLIRILGALRKRRDKFDRIIVETTGMADPGPVAQTFFVDEDIKSQFRLDGVVTVVDAHHLLLHLDYSDECRQQIAFADVVLLNKVDLATTAEIEYVERRIGEMNALARVLKSERAAVPVADVLNIGGFDLDRALATRPDFLQPEYPFEWGGIVKLEEGDQIVLHDGPDAAMKLVLMPVDGDDDLPLAAAAESAMRAFSAPSRICLPGQPVTAGNQPHQLLLEAPGPKPFPLCAAAPGFHALFTEHGPEEFAARLQRADGSGFEPRHDRSYRAGHQHDDSVGSVGIACPGAVDAERFDRWISTLLSTQGADIFRSKGIVNVHGHEQRYVFQGVHMLLEGVLDQPWGDRPRSNQLVFIGRKLDREALEAGFRSCLR